MTARITDSRQAGIADTDQIMPRQQIINELRPFLQLVVLMIAREPRMDIKVREQLPGMACILGGNKLHFTKHPHSPIGHILQVADWRSAQI